MGTFTPSYSIYSMNTILINIGYNKMNNIITIKDLQIEQWFTLKDIQEPKPNQVWVRNHYDRTSKTFSIINWETQKERFIKADKQVFIDFIF